MAITEREREIYSWPSGTPAERQKQVDALMELARDESDTYDGHHGTDRSEDSLAYARYNDPELAAHIENKIITDPAASA